MLHPRIQRMCNYLLQFNLFDKPSSTPQTTPKECLATRIYLTSLIVSLLVVALASTILVPTIDQVESLPSLTRFLHLSSLYPNTLQCPCSKLGIDYNTFVTVHVRFHQVCFSLAQATLNHDLLAIRRSITGNQLVSVLMTNFYLRRPPTHVDDSNVLKMTLRRFDNCSCLNNKGCPRSAIVVIDKTRGRSVSAPGMVVDCLMVDGTLASTLECYYQSTCFSLLHPSSSIDIPLLSNGTNTHFSVNDTIQVLLNGMMIDEVVTDIDLNLFYSECNPGSCSYSYSQRLNFLYSLMTLLQVTAIHIAEIVLQKRNRH